MKATNKEVVISNWRGYGTITVPKGTRVSGRTAMGPTDGSWFFVDQFEFLPEGLHHDAQHYGIRIEAADVSAMKWLVRYNLQYTLEVEADSAHQAVAKAEGVHAVEWTRAASSYEATAT
jgi:hypothetical protein